MPAPRPSCDQALTLCANGSTWADAAAAVGIKAPCLRRWYKDRRAEEFIESLVRENLNVANNFLTSAAPRLADELIQIALDPSVKAYARTQAISESFKILRENAWRLSSGGSCKRFGRHCSPSRTARKSLSKDLVLVSPLGSGFTAIC